MTPLIAVRVGEHELLVPDTPDDRLHELYTVHHQWYEGDLLAAIKERQTGGTFVDIGANHGNHTMFFALECKADRVIAVEPYPGEFEILTANVTYNQLEQVVTAVNALIHPAWRSVTLSAKGAVPLPVMWEYRNQPALNEHGATACLTLDELLDDVDVDVIKIDVEEAGPAVLKSGAHTLQRCRPLVAIEAEPSEQPAVKRILGPLGYKLAGQYCATPTFLWSPG